MQHAPAEYWVVITLQPRPDGSLVGEYSKASKNGCANKGTLTFTRGGDIDVAGLPDPAAQPPRVVSPAEALRGRYRQTVTFAANKSKIEADYTVRTDCLRTGDRCMSYFHNPDGTSPLVFGSERWTFDNESDGPCPDGGTSHSKLTVEFPLPAPPQDPITLLAGGGRLEETGASRCVSSNVDESLCGLAIRASVVSGGGISNASGW